MIGAMFACTAREFSDGEVSEDGGIESDTDDQTKTSPYVLVIPEGSSAELIAAVRELKAAILEKTGYSLEIKTDYVSWADVPNEYEILIGNTNRDESQQNKVVKVNDYAILTAGKKWVISGGSDDGTVLAITYFISNCMSVLFDVPKDYSYHYEGSYPVKSLTLCGKDISEYIMVYSDKEPALEKYAERLQQKFSALCGEVIPIYAEANAPKNTSAIHFGQTAQSECDFSNMGYDGYEVAASNGRVSIAAGCSTAYYNALAAVENKLASVEALVISSEDIAVNFDQVSREQYIANPELFVPVWKRSYTVGTVMSFEEKIAAFSSPNTAKVLSMAHRCEHEYYPEESVEAAISSWLAGVDAVELDIRRTADGVLVCMHDATLTRMTNFSDMKGKTVNGITLPTSENVSDWTYEQLMQLSLKKGSVVTEFKIATLEEMLVVSKDRFFIYLEDKQKAGTLLDEAYELMKKTGNYRSVLLGGTGAAMGKEKCVALQKKIKNETGITALIYVRASSGAATSTVNYLKANAVGPYGLLLNGSYNSDRYVGVKVAITQNAEHAIYGAWTLDDSTEKGSPELWQTMYDVGLRIIMVDDIFELLDFCKQKNK